MTRMRKPAHERRKWQRIDPPLPEELPGHVFDPSLEEAAQAEVARRERDAMDRYLLGIPEDGPLLDGTVYTEDDDQ